MNLPDYKSKTQISKQTRHVLENTNSILSTFEEEIPKREVADATELHKFTGTLETEVKLIEHHLLKIGRIEDAYTHRDMTKTRNAR